MKPAKVLIRTSMFSRELLEEIHKQVERKKRLGVAKEQEAQAQ